jgi:hypothetical protein
MHELFHHIVENGTSIMEIVLQNSEIYTSYISSVYAQVFNSHECLEESLANSFLLTASDICHIEKRYLEDELLNQGPGYNDFVHYIEPSKFRKGVRRLISQIRTGKLHPPVELPIEQVMNISNPIDYLHISNVPIWIHKRANPIHYDLYNGTCTPSC